MVHDSRPSGIRKDEYTRSSMIVACGINVLAYLYRKQADGDHEEHGSETRPAQPTGQIVNFKVLLNLSNRVCTRAAYR